jgi:hypothetical protein
MDGSIVIYETHHPTLWMPYKVTQKGNRLTKHYHFVSCGKFTIEKEGTNFSPLPLGELRSPQTPL